MIAPNHIRIPTKSSLLDLVADDWPAIASMDQHGMAATGKWSGTSAGTEPTTCFPRETGHCTSWRAHGPPVFRLLVLPLCQTSHATRRDIHTSDRKPLLNPGCPMSWPSPATSREHLTSPITLPAPVFFLIAQCESCPSRVTAARDGLGAAQNSAQQRGSGGVGCELRKSSASVSFIILTLTGSLRQEL